MSIWAFRRRFAKRLRNDQVMKDFTELFAHEGAVPAKKDDFQSVDGKAPAKLKEMQARLKAVDEGISVPRGWGAGIG